MKRSYWTRMGGISSVVLLAAALVCQTSSAATWGTTNWTQVLSNTVYATPAISPDGKIVYVATASDSATLPGDIIAFNATNGAIIRQWSDKGTNTQNGQWGTWSSPIVSRDGSTIYSGGYDGHVFAFNANGTTNAVFTVGDPTGVDYINGQALFERPLTSSDTNAGYIFQCCSDKKLYCFAINNTSAPVWAHNVVGSPLGAPAIGPDGLVYAITRSNQLYAFDMQGNTNHVWQLGSMTPGYANFTTPCFGEANGKYAVYAVVPDPNAALYSFSLDTYTLNWSTNVTGSSGQAMYCGPSIGPDGTVYVGGDNGIYGHNPANGARTVFMKTAAAVHCVPAIGMNGTVFTTEWNNPLYAFNPDGTTNKLFGMDGGSTYCSPTIGADGTIYVGGYFGAGATNIWAFNNTEPLASENSFWPKKNQNTRNTSLSKPSAPTIASVSIDVSDTLVSWSSSPVAMAYLVYKNTTTNFSTASVIATNSWTNTAYTDAGEGALNYYWVRAWNDSGLSSVGAWASATPLPVPAGVSASDGTYTDKVRVKWDAVSGFVSYEVWRNTSSNFSSASKISSPALNELGLEDASATADATYYLVYDDASATAGINYYYWVKAVNDVGNKSLSTSDSGYLGVVGPLITANGLLGNVYLNAGDPVTVAIQMMNMDPYAGLQVDWWVIAFAHGQWYYMNNLFQWTYFNGDLHSCHPVYQGPLANIGPAPVLSGGILGAGTYTFWFAIDYPRNGILNGDMMLYDSVNVIVQ